MAYGLAPGWDVYLRGGGSDSTSQGDLDIHNSANGFGGLGFHGRLYEYKPWNLALGPVGNIMFYQDWTDRGSDTIDGIAVNGRVKVKDHYSASLGFGFQWKPIPGFTFFGGPFYFYEPATLDFTLSGNGRTFSDSVNVHTKTSFGPRFGLVTELTKGINLTIEGQYRNYLSGGASIGFNF